MYRFFVNQEDVSGKTAVIRGGDVNHIRNVLRMKPGDPLLLCDGRNEYCCRITSLSEEEVLADIEDVDGAQTELPAEITLFQGLPKSDKMDLIIQKTVELGVHEVVPVVTSRTVVKLDPRKEETRRKRWNAISESAAKQSKRGMIPKVLPVCTLREALEALKGYDLRLIPYELSGDLQTSSQVIQQAVPGKRIGILIGPEGGFTEEEVEQARQAGAVPISLGKRILRTETAGMMLLSVLVYQLEIHQ